MRGAARLPIPDFRFPDLTGGLRASRARLLIHQAIREGSAAAAVAAFGREPAEIVRARRFRDSFRGQQLLAGSDRPASRLPASPRTTLRSSGSSLRSGRGWFGGGGSLRSTTPRVSASVFLGSRNDRGGRRRADLACILLPDPRARSQVPERASKERRVETDEE